MTVKRHRNRYGGPPRTDFGLGGADLKHETARRLAQRIKTVLDVARARGFRNWENPVTAIHDGHVTPTVGAKVVHYEAMPWRDVPAIHARLRSRNAMAAKVPTFTCLTGSRKGKVFGTRWEEVEFDARIWICPAARINTGYDHRLPLKYAMIEILTPLQALSAEIVFERQKRHQPLSKTSMSMLLRRMDIEDATVHGFRSTFRNWAAEVANAPRELAEMSLAHKFGSDVERAYARSYLLERRRELTESWSTRVLCKSPRGEKP